MSVGWLGQLRPAVADAHDVPQNDVVWVAEIDLDRLAPSGTVATRRATPLPRYPAAIRDIAILVDESLSAATVRGTIRSRAPETLVQVVEFETDDPSMRGEMIVRYTLVEAGGTTYVAVEHENLPPGLSEEDNAIGWRVCLAQLARLVEGG